MKKQKHSCIHGRMVNWCHYIWEQFANIYQFGVVVLFFLDSLSLCSLPGTYHVDQAGFKLPNDPPVSAS